MNPGSEVYRSQMLHPFKFWLGMWSQLPSVGFWGIKMKSLDSEKCEVYLPFNWRTKNPFRSIYFSALSGAAELSTGALVQMYIKGKSPHSMLVVDFRAEFYKKATTGIVFICNQGKQLSDGLDNLKNKGDSFQIILVSRGLNAEGAEVMKASITWSIMKK